MTSGERYTVAVFMDRDTWKHTEHMKRDQWEQVDILHPDNIARIRDEIRCAVVESEQLMRRAREVEAIMDREVTK